MTQKTFLIVALGAVLAGAVEAGGAELPRPRFVWADFDGDGLEDVYVARPEGRDSLFRNQGDGSFEDVTERSLPCVACASIEVVWRDVDLDRRPDLLRVLVSGSVELLRNRGDGVFEDATLSAGLEHVAGASSARWLDYDADGRADLELTTERSPVLFHNLGDFLFEPVTLADFGAAASEEASPVRALPGAFEGESPIADARRTLLDDPTTPSRARAAAELSGALVDKVHPDPLVPGTPGVDPLEPNDDLALALSPFGKRCALSVKDTDSGECVLVSTLPTLGDLYPLSANLFVSTGGDVGIGTTSPAAKLEVAGTARMTDTLTLDPSGDQALDVSTGSIYKSGALFIHTKGGAGNSAFGRDALAGVSSGFRNTGSGHQALSSNTSGYRNTASGYQALFFNSAGHSNTASGDYALHSNTTGIRNTANGSDALRSNTTGNDNTANGFYALGSNTTGYSNTANGFRALSFNTTGVRNTANGSFALRYNTTGKYNTANGSGALFANTTGVRNTANGFGALRSNTTGNFNAANGSYALRFNTTGSFNAANGTYALRFNTTGSFNTANGLDALRSNTIGNLNTANGFRSLFYNSTGQYNTANGSFALFSNTTGIRNTASGAYALYDNTEGIANVALGIRALSNNSTGSRNIALGQDAGISLTVGSDNIAIGNNSVAGESGTIRIGTSGSHTRAFIAGIRGVTTVNADAIPVLVDSAGQLGTVSSSRRFKKDIADMGDATERLLELRPVMFRYEQEQQVSSGEVPLKYGLIAEEVAEIFPDLVVYDEEGLPFTVKYHLLSSMLLNELKKLSSAHAIEVREHEEQGRELARLRGLEARLAALEARTSPALLPAAVTAVAAGNQ